MEEHAVECHAGHTYPQRPTAVHWQGERFVVSEVQAQWRTPQGVAFRVVTEGGLDFELLYEEASDRWQMTPR
jgi:hypothetical protein